MAACNFSIPFSGTPENVLGKAKSAVQGQGGTFDGDTNSGNFHVNVFGNTIAGSYTVLGNEMQVVIDSKPFLIPCSTIESFLKSQIAG
jgi:hypothetical protein